MDIQCIFPKVENVAKKFHTKIISTMKEAKLTNAVHIPFEEENADETAKKILETAIENFSKRGKYIYLPRGASPPCLISPITSSDGEDGSKPVFSKT